MRPRRYPLFAPLLALAVPLALAVAALTPAPALANPGTWTGNGANPNWTTPGNWFGAVAPAPGEPLDFPATALQLTTNNDFPDFTAFNSFTFEQSGYTLGGRAVTLTAGITASHVSGTNTINLALITSGAQTWTVTNAGARLAANSILTSSGSTV